MPMTSRQRIEAALSHRPPDRTPIFVLPANPVDTLLSFELYVRPLIRRLAGRVAIHHRTMQLPTATALDSAVGETRYIRAVVEARAGTLTAVSVEGSDEHPLAGLGTSDAVIVLGPDQGAVPAGTTVLLRTTDAALPHWDAFILVFSVISQWLQARKRLENWAGWMMVNVVAVLSPACRVSTPDSVVLRRSRLVPLMISRSSTKLPMTVPPAARSA